MTSRRKEIFFVALCVVFSALFTIGCSDSLLHPAQDGARILVQLENSSLRSGDTPPPTEKWQGSAWIENQDGSESHHQKISSETDELSITFENVVVGSEIRIHLDVTSSGETAKRYRGSSNWKKIIDGVNVIVIVLKEVVEQGGDEPGQENPPSQEPGTTTPEGELTSINATYKGEYLLVGVTPTNFTVIENYSGGNRVEISSIDGLYTVDVPENSIGNVPVTIKSKDGSMQTQITVPIMYELDVDNLTITGGDTVTQNGTLELTAEYKADGNDVQYKLYDGSGSSDSHKVIEKVDISWTGVNHYEKWTANAETNTVGPKTATVKLSKGGDQWCVTTGGIEKPHTYTVNALEQVYDIGDAYPDEENPIGYVFEVNDSYIKIVEKNNNGWQYYWCGVSSNINNWSDLINISDGEEMYNAMKNQPTGDNSIFTYANNKNTSGESGWYIPTKEELFDIFIMDKTHGVLNISGAYWSSSLESITGGFTAYYVQGPGESNDSGTSYVDEENNVIAVKKITLN